MTANKHTPGWYCANCQRGVDAREVTFSEQHEACGRFIADDEPPSAERQRLNESAPDLLEALILAREEFAGLPHSLGYDFTHLPKIDAMIAKATGGAA